MSSIKTKRREEKQSRQDVRMLKNQINELTSTVDMLRGDISIAAKASLETVKYYDVARQDVAEFHQRERINMFINGLLSGFSLAFIILIIVYFIL